VSRTWRILVYSPGLFLLLARVGFIFSLALPAVITSSSDGRLEVFFGVGTTAIASRLFLGPGGLNPDQTRCISFSGLHQCSALILFNNLQLRAINLRVLASNVHHVFCVLQSASPSFPIRRSGPQRFDIFDSFDLPLATTFEKAQLAMKTLHRASCHEVFRSACVGTWTCMSCTLDLQLAP